MYLICLQYLIFLYLNNHDYHLNLLDYHIQHQNSVFFHNYKMEFQYSIIHKNHLNIIKAMFIHLHFIFCLIKLYFHKLLKCFHNIQNRVK